LQINEGKPSLVHLPDPPASASVSSHKVDVVLAADDSATIDWRADVVGVEASEWRARFHAEATRKQRAQQLLGTMLPGTEVSAVEASNLEDVEQKVTMHLRGKAPQFARAEGDLLSVPLGRREHMIRDFAQLSERKENLRLYAQWTQLDEWVVRLPAGAKTRSLPGASSETGPFGSYSLEVEGNAGSIRVKTAVTLTKTRIAVAEYPAFREWCEKVDRALGQRATVALK
jgi:hypothetical protein